MFKRKLKALEYDSPDDFDVNDKNQLRELVNWLEDEKIQHYKEEDRSALKNVDSDDWDIEFMKYIDELSCPTTSGKINEIVEWLLGYTVRKEFTSNSKFSTLVGDCKNVLVNPPDKFQSEQFKEEVNKLASMVDIVPHPDHLLTLQAVSKQVTCFSEEAEKPKSSTPGELYPFDELDKTCYSEDKLVNYSCKAMKLIFLKDLRNLQTRVNECLVIAQEITASPTTDSSLGKVGR